MAFFHQGFQQICSSRSNDVKILNRSAFNCSRVLNLPGVFGFDI
jgi:hypothetical protein